MSLILLFVSHRGISRICIGRLFDINLFATFRSRDDINFPLLRLNLYEPVTTSSLIVKLNLKCWLQKPSPDYIIEAKEVYIQLSFERYKGELVLRF